ncbi:MAG: hypothetical protein JWM41_4589 [Gemmatimonadetes bacterium]|nr:hypothetical protein [Gemmatimonadota bacterium]
MTTMERIAAALVLAAGLHARPALAQSHAGTWDGTVTTQQGAQPTTITLDSTSTGWRGTLLAPMFNGQAMPFSSVTVKGDTVSMTLPIQNGMAEMRGVVAGSTHVLSGQLWFDGTDAGTFSFARKAKAPGSGMTISAPVVLLSAFVPSRLWAAPPDTSPSTTVPRPTRASGSAASRSNALRRETSRAGSVRSYVGAT